MGGFCIQIVEVNIRVSAFCKRLACQLLATIDQPVAVGKPSHFLHTAERRVRAVELLAFQQIDLILQRRIVGHEEVAVGAVGPVVPVTVHQVVVDHGIGIGQVGVAFLDRLLQLYVAKVADVLHIGRIAETVDVAIYIADSLGVRAVGIGLPDLHAIVVGTEEGDFLAGCISFSSVTVMRVGSPPVAGIV